VVIGPYRWIDGQKLFENGEVRSKIERPIYIFLFLFEPCQTSKMNFTSGAKSKTSAFFGERSEPQIVHQVRQVGLRIN